ncbi:MAG: PIN domain-containing protein [Candidatus Hydrothermarchaeales archaeon]
MELEHLVKGPVFVDTSILIYAFTNTRYSKTCEDFLGRVKYGEVEGYINSTVLDEFFHKLVIFEVYTKKKLVSQNAVKFLKSNPAFIKSLNKPFKASREVLKDYGFKILDTSNVLEKALNISREYGLLFSDALHSACCKVYDIKDIATNDGDFERVDFLKVWKP